ncbi:MAG: pyruvate dehydrogenase (acetyl-transferring), homodimeric type, partial [bacterium]|nr:pyruvate dehydrogenase (acetyl-transferring), homodimeric type [bacterium]
MHRPQNPGDDDPWETEDWIESLEGVIAHKGSARAQFLLDRLIQAAAEKGVKAPMPLNTPYINTIATEDQPDYPGDQAIEWKIRCIVRWNAMAMVVRANELAHGIGGHISTFASAATLYEVAFNHYLKGKEAEGGGDLVYFQGHASPGIYARSFLEGRFSQEQLL